MNEKTPSPSAGRAGRLRHMGKFWNWMGRAADGISVWQIIGSFSWAGAVTWAVADVKTIADLGWGAVFLIGVAFACVTIFILMATLALFRVFRPLPKENPPPAGSMDVRPSTGISLPSFEWSGPAKEKVQGPTAPAFNLQGLYVGWVQVETKSAEQERIIQIVMFGFNASGLAVAIRAAEGTISYEVRPIRGGAAEGGGALPPPRLKTEVFQNEAVGNFSQFAIALEQRVPLDFIAALSKIPSGYAIHLIFEKLSVYADPISMNATRVSLPLWYGAALRQSDVYLPGRIISGVMKA